MRGPVGRPTAALASFLSAVSILARALRTTLGVLVPLALTTCSSQKAEVIEGSPTAVWIANLVMRVQAEVTSPDSIRFVGTIANHGRDTWYLRYSHPCGALHVQAHRTPQRTDPPVWDSRRERDPVTGLPLPCFSNGATRQLAPRDSLVGQFGLALTPHELLGDSLPEGRYYFTAAFELTASHYQFDPNPIRAWVYMPAGGFRLRR